MIGSKPVVDADAHYFEPIGDFGQYVDGPWSDRLTGEHAWGVLPQSSGDRFMGGRLRRDEISYPQEEMTPEEIPRVMKKLGVDDIILLPNKMLNFGDLSGEERAIVLANAYVDYMLDQVVDPDKGIYTMIVAPYQHPEEAVKLIDRVGDEKGVVAVCMITGGPEPPLGARRYDPIYEAAEDAGLPVVFHSAGSGIDDFYIRGYETFIETHMLGFLWNNMAQLTSIVIQGLPEKFPDLDIVFQESGLFYVPLVMHRLDSEYLKRRSEAPLLKKLPSEYISEFYFGTQPLEIPQDESHLAQVVEMIGGAERIIFATDYPHWDYDEPSVITERSFLNDKEQSQILGGNAKRVFGL